MNNKVVIVCPIRMLENAIQPSGGTLDEILGCFETCAGYDDENECCAMLSLAQSRGKDGGEA